MRTLTRRYGHRGLWLVLLGGIWLVFGVGLLLRPETPVPGAIHQMVPQAIRTAMWIVSAAVAIAVGLRGRGKDDSIGHLALWLMPAFRLLSYSCSWFLYVISTAVGVHPALGYSQGWYPALIWVFVVTMLRLVAAWPNPSPMPSPPAVLK